MLLRNRKLSEAAENHQDGKMPQHSEKGTMSRGVMVEGHFS